MLTQEVTHTPWTLSHTSHPSSDHRVKIPFPYIIYSDFEMFTTHWELKVFFSSLQVPNPKPTEEYGIFCADFTPALNSSPLERIGIPARGHLQGKELLHPPGNGLCSASASRNSAQQRFPLPSYPVFQSNSASLWTAGCAEKSQSEFHLERAPLQGTALAALSCLLTVQGGSQDAGALSVLSPGHFYHTASPQTGTGLPKRQWIRINFRLKPRARDDFLLPQNRHCLPAVSSQSKALPGPGLDHLFLNPVFCCENTKSEICCLLIKQHYKVKSNQTTKHYGEPEAEISHLQRP